MILTYTAAGMNVLIDPSSEIALFEKVWQPTRLSHGQFLLSSWKVYPMVSKNVLFYIITVELGNKELFGRPKIVP